MSDKSEVIAEALSSDRVDAIQAALQEKGIVPRPSLPMTWRMRFPLIGLSSILTGAGCGLMAVLIVWFAARWL